MALAKRSAFYYGHKIDENNNLINFTDAPSGPEKTAEIPVGTYTLTKFLEVVVAAFNAASSNDWSGSVDRETRIITLVSSAACDLLLGTGSNALNTPASLLGFAAADILNATSFVGSLPSGSEWAPQFPLQDYKGKTLNKKLVNAVVTKSASGDNVSVQSFGIDRFIKLNAKYITNEPTDGLLSNDPEGIEKAIAFMDYAVEKYPVEFMEDAEDRESFDRVYLESTPQSGDGTQYELTEYVDRSLPGYFETGVLTFKVINVE